MVCACLNSVKQILIWKSLVHTGRTIRAYNKGTIAYGTRDFKEKVAKHIEAMVLVEFQTFKLL